MSRDEEERWNIKVSLKSSEQETNQPRESLKRDLIQGKSRHLQTLDGLHNQYQELPLELLSLRAFLHIEAAVAAATASTAATTTDSHFQESGHSDTEAGHHNSLRTCISPATGFVCQ